jgi:RimJ/RimL family protein N-acetyltransferase
MEELISPRGMEPLEIGRLPEERWRDYRSIRLEALESESQAFSSSFEEEAGFSEQTWKARLRNVLFALAGGRPVGTVVIMFSDRLKTRHVANIFGVYVSHKYRNRGIGSRLLESAIAFAEGHKEIRKIKLTVNPEQEFAVQLYLSHGFRIVGRFSQEVQVNGKFSDEVLMEKALDRAIPTES